MVYDLVYDYEIPQGPLIEREKEVIAKLQENLRALTELCLVINSYERLQVANGEINEVSILLWHLHAFNLVISNSSKTSPKYFRKTYKTCNC